MIDNATLVSWYIRFQDDEISCNSVYLSVEFIKQNTKEIIPGKLCDTKMWLKDPSISAVFHPIVTFHVVHNIFAPN